MSKRQYRSDKRRKQAEATKEAIVNAGKRLFLQQGYIATTVAQIATEAGVSEPTVYASVNGKRGILLALVESVDELGDKPIAQEAMTESDPRRFIQLAMKYNRQVIERGRDVIKLLTSTAPLDEEVATVMKSAMNKDRQVASEIAKQLAERGKLQPHLNIKQVGDIISVMLMPTLYLTLLSYGWSYDECEAWISDTLIKILLISSVNISS